MRKKMIFTMASFIWLSVGAPGYAADKSADMPEGVHVKEVITPGGPVEVLADSKGMTLYTFDMDRDAGKSVCTGQCAVFWPPLLAGADVQDMDLWSVVTRPDGVKIWAYNGKPLYTFSNDSAVEDFGGNGVPQDNPVWHCALPM